MHAARKSACERKQNQRAAKRLCKGQIMHLRIRAKTPATWIPDESARITLFPRKHMFKLFCYAKTIAITGHDGLSLAIIS